MKSELVSAVERLIAQQSTAWPRLAEGIEGLARSETRLERVRGRRIFVRHIPHRIRSTTARVDQQSIAARPCFLCAGNLDAEEQGIAFGNELTIYCNPFPILEKHLTIVHRDHRPQRIEGQFLNMLHLAKALDDSFVLYNGPGSGASAPDHLHFQACARTLFPIQEEISGLEGLHVPNFTPRAFVFHGDDEGRIALRLESLRRNLSRLTAQEPEPMVNVAAWFSQGEYVVVVFPRAKHRPAVFHSGELTVSPGTIDLCGVFVLPVKKDYDKIRSADIESILEEVTLPQDVFDAALLAMKEVE
jgi:hypothetical protein